MSRIGLGRHGLLDSEAGDPLDGLVNLFDLGIVLAVAFLIAGLGVAVKKESAQVNESAQPSAQTTIREPQQKTTAKGQGQAVGQVYRLPDGRLVLVGPTGKPVSP